MLKLCIICLVVESSAAINYDNNLQIEGSTIFSGEYIKQIIRDNVEISQSNKQEYAQAVGNVISNLYSKEGYVAISSVDWPMFLKGKFKFTVVEGRLNEVLIDERLRKIKYVDEYITSLKDMAPFNIHKAQKLLALIKKVLGGEVSIEIKYIQEPKHNSNKIFDLVVTRYKKYKGVLYIHNHNSPKDNITGDPLSNAISLTKGSQFSLGNISFKANNPFNQPGELTLAGSTSGSSLQNNAFIKYKHQIYNNGLTWVNTFSFYQNRYLITKTDNNFKTGIEFPLVYDLHHSFNFYSLYSYEQYSNNVPDDSRLHYHFKVNKAVNTKIDTRKLIFGFNNIHRSFYHNNYNLDLSFHVGKGKVKQKDRSFTKFVLNSTFEYNISPKLVLNFDLDGQLAPDRLPTTEAFQQRNSYGGRGMLYWNFDAQSAVTATPQISYLHRVNHPVVFLLKPYAYYEYSVGSSFPRDDRVSANFRNDGIGTGLDIYLVDHLILNLEYNRRIGPGEKIMKKKSNIFAGLIYNVSFNTFG